MAGYRFKASHLAKCLGVFCAVLALAQEPIRVGVKEVIVPVSVVASDGKFVTGLTKDDFDVFDQGKPQTITDFSGERYQPVVVGFLLDQSNASRIHWKEYQTAASDLITNLMPEGKNYSGYLIGYSGQADLLVDTTTNPETIASKIKKLSPGGGSAMFDAVYMAVTSRKFIKREPIEPRRIVIIIGDGHDNASSKTLEEVLELAQRNLVTIYGISTLAYGATNEEDNNLVRLARETGGIVEYPLQNVYKDVAGFFSQPKDEGNYVFDVGTGGYAAAQANAIFKSIENIAGEISTQYVIHYVPDVPFDSTQVFRSIKVKVHLPDVTVRARYGYYPFTVVE
jgi:VWFA-related protein